MSFYSINHAGLPDAETATVIYVSKYLNDGTLEGTTKLTNWLDSAYNQLAVEELPNGNFLLAFQKQLVLYSADFSSLKKQVDINDLFPSSNVAMVDVKPLSHDLYLGYAYRGYDSATSTYTQDIVTFVIDTNLEAKSDLSTALSHFGNLECYPPSISARPDHDQFTVLSSPKNGENYLENSHGDVFLQQLNVQVPNNVPSGSVSFTGDLKQGDTVAAQVALTMQTV